MDFGEQGKFRLSHVQFDAKFMKGVTCSAIPSTTSCVKCLFSRREKELNRPCQCDTNLTTGTQALSLLPPNATLSTAQNTCSYCTLSLTESLTGSLSNADSDGNDNENSNRPIQDQMIKTTALHVIHTFFSYFPSFFLFFLHFLTFAARLRRENS